MIPITKFKSVHSSYVLTLNYRNRFYRIENRKGSIEDHVFIRSGQIMLLLQMCVQTVNASVISILLVPGARRQAPAYLSSIYAEIVRCI